MIPFDRSLHSHRRRDALTGRWVLVSPQRSRRPWQGASSRAAGRMALASHDPACHLCAGNLRATGERNPPYGGVHVFANDFPALTPFATEACSQGDALFASEPARGEARVICFSPDHGRGLGELSLQQVQEVVEAWCAQTAELGAQHRWVQVFENKGEMMGCSSPHPHGQVWATDHLPGEALLEHARQREHFEAHRRPLLLDYAQREAELGERVVIRSAHWLAVVPYWATWPFETLLLPLGRASRLPELSRPQRRDLAEVVQQLVRRYDALFDCSFPYSMGWHGAPFGDGPADPAWQVHAHFYPPLLRSASVRKFMVGYEMLAEAQRDITPEQAAEKLRAAGIAIDNGRNAS